jgi:hypothetical protein
MIIAFLLGTTWGPHQEPAPTSTSLNSSLSGSASATSRRPVPAPTTPASSCGNFLEAILTGSEADITASLQAIRADKAADPTAREFAKQYSDRPPANTSREQTDIGIAEDYCSR